MRNGAVINLKRIATQHSDRSVNGKAQEASLDAGSDPGEPVIINTPDADLQ